MLALARGLQRQHIPVALTIVIDAVKPSHGKEIGRCRRTSRKRSIFISTR